MNPKSCAVVCMAAVLAVALAPAAAQADTYVSPFVGVTFGGETESQEMTFGGSITFMGRGMGLEVEAAHTPDFYPGFNITTYSASYVAGGDANRGGGIKPFGVVGVTLMRSSVEGLSDASANKFAFNLGGGIVALFTRTIGIRGEVRYFRRLQDDQDGFIPLADDFDFFRGNVGIVLRF